MHLYFFFCSWLPKRKRNINFSIFQSQACADTIHLCSIIHLSCVTQTNLVFISLSYLTFIRVLFTSWSEIEERKIVVNTWGSGMNTQRTLFLAKMLCVWNVRYKALIQSMQREWAGQRGKDWNCAIWGWKIDHLKWLTPGTTDKWGSVKVLWS